MSGYLTTPEDELTWIALHALMGELAELAMEELDRRLTDHGFDGIRLAHSHVFGFIEPDGSRLTELALRARLTKQAVGQAADDLQRLGYVERVPDPLDGRAKIIRFTPRGHEARDAAVAVFRDLEERWAKLVGAERVADFRELLETVVASER